ncbi:MAG TPA: ArgE/DapE family deacylase [Thermomicrobiales bacterium]|nr:ArgE/DapE family deacylase [Thermomicrobiales bacterium]
MPIEASIVRQIRDAVDAGRIDTVAMLQELVRTPSVTGSEGNAQRIVEILLSARRLTIDRWEATADDIAAYHDHVGVQTVFADRPNVAGRRQGIGAGRSILLNAHIDTVETGDPTTWSVDPLGGDVREGRLYGRGACDMKGGLVSFLAAFDALDALGIVLAGDATILSTVGEEDGGLGALSAVLRGHRADAVLITEPTRLSLVPAQGGSLVFRLTVDGKSAHAAVRDRGVSALEKFIPIFEDLLWLERERNATLRHPLYQHIQNKVPMNIGVVRSGLWASTVPESLIAEGRIGLIPGEDVGVFRQQVIDRITRAAQRDPWLREHPPRIEWFGGQFAPAETPVDSPIARAVLSAHTAVTGSPPAIEGVPYGADMRLFTIIGGMPCVMYGAGDVDIAHHADEHIVIDDLLTAATTIACLLVDWCGVSRS